MGQQQLLLLVLGIVIVGLAVVAGINAFSTNQVKSERDALINEGMRIATDVIAQEQKPSQLGGGTPADLTDAGYEQAGTSGDPYTTPWGDIQYSEGDNEITLHPKSSTETATIDVSGDAPQVTSGGGGGTWSTP